MMRKNCQVLLILKTPPPFGGGEVRAALLLDHVARDAGFAVIEVHSGLRTRANQGSFAAWKLLEFVSLWFRLFKVLLRARPRVVYLSTAHGFIPFLRDSLLVWTAWALRAEVAGELAGERFRFLDGGLIARSYGKYVLSRFAAIRLLGTAIAADLSARGIHNTVVIDNGCEVPIDFEYLPESQDGVVNFLFVGNHSPAKGFDVLIRALQIVRDQGIAAELATIGGWHTDAFRDAMLTLVTEAGIEDIVHMHGTQSGKAKWDVFRESQCLVLPSLTEGQPISILEAFGCGLPVIATRVGGIPDVVGDGVNGLLVESSSVDALADAMTRVAQDVALRRRMSAANRLAFASRFTAKRYVRNHTEWLESLITV